MHLQSFKRVCVFMVFVELLTYPLHVSFIVEFPAKFDQRADGIDTAYYSCFYLLGI